MATGNFFSALGYKFYVKEGTTASTAPASESGMTEVLSLENAGISISTDTVDVLDYGSDMGFKASVVTGQNYEIPMTMNLDLNDAGYQLLREAAQGAATGVTVEWYRESPVLVEGGSAETCAGVAWVTNFSEDIQAGNIAKVSFTLKGYGEPEWTAGSGAPAPTPAPTPAP